MPDRFVYIELTYNRR